MIFPGCKNIDLFTFRKIPQENYFCDSKVTIKTLEIHKPIPCIVTSKTVYYEN